MSHEHPLPASQPASPAGPGAGLQRTGRNGERRSAPARAASLLLCLSPPPASSTCVFHGTPDDGACLRQRSPGAGVTAPLPWSSVGTQCSPRTPACRCPALPQLCPPPSDSLVRMGLGGCLPQCASPGLQVAEAEAEPAQCALPGAGGASRLPFSVWVFPLIW